MTSMEISGSVVQVAVGKPRQFGREGADDPMDRPWETGFFKSPVTGEVRLNLLGLEGDGQADLVHHGGPDKAVLCYAAEHYPVWREEFRQSESIGQRLDIESFGNGAFGENLTIQGQSEANVCLGDVYEVGSATIQVSQPRQPCWKLARRWRLKELTALAVSTGRMGWYVRVVREGTLSAGHSVRLVERTLADWPISRLNQLFYHDRQDLEAAAFLAECPLLAEAWRGEFRKRLEKAGR